LPIEVEVGAEVDVGGEVQPPDPFCRRSGDFYNKNSETEQFVHRGPVHQAAETPVLGSLRTRPGAQPNRSGETEAAELMLFLAKFSLIRFVFFHRIFYMT
jgi:hypothetical protein